MTLRKVLIASASPDALNVNSALREYLVEGFRGAFSDMETIGVPYEAALPAAMAFRPDLAVVFGSVMLDVTDYTRFADAVGRNGGRLAFWLHDDPYEFDANERIFPLADIIFTNDEASVDFYPVDLPVHHLPLGASAFAHTRPVGRRAAPDLFFCGHLFENRRRFLQALHDNTAEFSTRVLAMGSVGTEARPEWWNPQTVPNRTLPDFYAAAVAVLNIGRDLSLANQRYMIKQSTPGPRTFEAACAGAAQIFVGDGLEVENYFEAEREILLADSIDTFIAQWRRLTDNPELSLEIGRRAQARALAEHTYVSRAKTLVKLATAS